MWGFFQCCVKSFEIGWSFSQGYGFVFLCCGANSHSAHQLKLSLLFPISTPCISNGPSHSPGLEVSSLFYLSFRRCRKAIPVATSAYLEGLPSHYTQNVHVNQVRNSFQLQLNKNECLEKLLPWFCTYEKTSKRNTNFVRKWEIIKCWTIFFSYPTFSSRKLSVCFLCTLADQRSSIMLPSLRTNAIRFA